MKQELKCTAKYTESSRSTMTDVFYDVKAKAKVEAEITDKVVYGEGTKQRYAFKGKTADGRNLTKFVSKAKFDEADI